LTKRGSVLSMLFHGLPVAHSRKMSFLSYCRPGPLACSYPSR
jgi:hypothetical protein